MTIPFPREHGVWAMLGASLTGGFLIAGRIDRVGLSLVIGLSLLLMSKAPIRDFLREPARSQALWAGTYLMLSSLFLLPALPRLPRGLIVLSLVVMSAAVPLYLAAMRKRKEMRIKYEIPAMALLALAAPYAYAVSGGKDIGVMMTIFVMTFVYYSGSSFRVRSTPGSKSLRPGLVYDLAAIGGVFTAALAKLIPGIGVLAFLPFLENVWRALRPKREKLSYLGRVELLKVGIYLFFLVWAYRA